MYITRRIGEAMPFETSYEPIKKIKRPYEQYQQQQQQFPIKPTFNSMPRISPTEVSETDLYLLSAIEKLAYRVDYLEQRMKHADKLLLHLMTINNDNNKKEKPEIGKNNIFF